MMGQGFGFFNPGQQEMMAQMMMMQANMAQMGEMMQQMADVSRASIQSAQGKILTCRCRRNRRLPNTPHLHHRNQPRSDRLVRRPSKSHTAPNSALIPSRPSRPNRPLRQGLYLKSHLPRLCAGTLSGAVMPDAHFRTLRPWPMSRAGWCSAKRRAKTARTAKMPNVRNRTSAPPLFLVSSHAVTQVSLADWSR